MPVCIFMQRWGYIAIHGDAYMHVYVYIYIYTRMKFRVQKSRPLFVETPQGRSFLIRVPGLYPRSPTKMRFNISARPDLATQHAAEQLVQS